MTHQTMCVVREGELWAFTRPGDLLLEQASESLEGLLEHRLQGPAPRVPEPADVGWGLRMCIAHKFPGDAAATCLGTTV